MRTALSLSCLTLSACVSSTAGLNISALDLSKVTQTESSLANEFSKVCLASKGNVQALPTQLERQGWAVANAEQLKSAGLARLRKKVLEIPGGGSRFKESQKIYIKEIDTGVYIVNLEEHFERGQLSSNKCALYANEPILFSCTAMGKILKKPPDHNQKYAQQKAHFIRWDLAIEKSSAQLVCKHTPSSQVLAYEGTVISLSVDMREPTK